MTTQIGFCEPPDEKMDNYNNGNVQQGVFNSLTVPRTGPPRLSGPIPEPQPLMLPPCAPPMIDAYEETDMIVINSELPKMAASIARFKTLVLLKILVLLLTVICLLLICFLYTIYIDKNNLLHQLEEFSDHHASILEQVQELHRDQVERRLEESIFQNDMLKKRIKLSDKQLKDCNGGSASINVYGQNLYLIVTVIFANKLAM